MIVDDHAGFRQVAKALLQATGAECVEYGDGRKAIAGYAESRPDVVLMDIAMEGLDGLRATAQIKAAFPAARILMLTQYDDPDLRKAAERAGACGYVLKDDLAQLPPLLRTMLEA